MKILLKIFAFILLLLTLANAKQTITTGELIEQLPYSTSWPPAALVRPSLPYTYDTDYFRIHYDTTGQLAVYHPNEDINPVDGVPDYINRMGDYLEECHHVYIQVLGFDSSVPDEGNGGNDKYDIYVTDITGLTVPEFRSGYYPDRLAYAAYSFIGRDLRNEHHPDDPLPFLKATCAHEYFHAIQMAYRAFTSDETAWWYELTANWAEERVYDDVNEVYYYLNDYYSNIDKSIYLTGGAFMYGAWPLAEFLSQSYGNDIIRQIFEKLITLDHSVYAIDATLGQHSTTLNTAFTAFGGWNYFTNTNWHPGFFDEGMDFPTTVPIAISHSRYPTGTIETPVAMHNMGIGYVFFNNSGNSKANLVINFTAGPSNPTGLALGIIFENRPVVFSVRKVDQGENITMRINGFTNALGAVLAINWPYQPSVSPSDSASYHYDAEIDSMASDIVGDNLDTPAEFQLEGNYPNPFNSSSTIIFDWHFVPIEYTISIYDISGRRVELLEGVAATGKNKVNWKAANNLAGGIYLYRLAIGERHLNGKMLFLK